MNPARRRWLARLAGLAGLAGGTTGSRSGIAQAQGPIDPDDAVSSDRPLRFPRDHGAHPGTRIEWWYATGWLAATAGHEPAYGFQVTFFRSRTGLAGAVAGRFAPRQLLFAHAAVTDLAARRHHHAQRLTRWSGDEKQADARAARADTDLALGRWRLARGAQPGHDGAPNDYHAVVADDRRALALDLRLQPTQPLLLQGRGGWSRKGPGPGQASHYYSQPHLAVRGQLVLEGRVLALAGTGWLDHEWSDELMPTGAAGWDWIGINLADGAALTAFRLRRGDGSSVWAGGSFRPAGRGAVRVFEASEVLFEPVRRWRSPHSGAEYPVRWRIACPAGRYELHALLDAQELDSRASTGALYWEGLSELRDTQDRRVGLGYLEMTGYATPLRL